MNNKQTYQDIIDRASSTLLFQQQWWLDTVTESEDWSFVQSQHGDALPYVLDQKFGFTFIRPPLLTPYLPNIDVQDVDSLEQLIRLLPANSEWIIPLSPDQNQVSDMIWERFGCEQKSRTTFILDLQNEKEDIWRNINKTKQRHIRKAQKTLNFYDSRFDSNHFVQFHQLAFQQKEKSYPYTETLIEKIVTNAIEHKAVYCSQAYFEETLIGQIACFYDAHTMYYLLGSFDPQYRQYNAMSGLMYRSIQHGSKLGLKLFDFEGSSDEGIANFFSQFGGTKTHYTILSHINNPIWRLKRKILG